MILASGTASDLTGLGSRFKFGQLADNLSFQYAEPVCADSGSP